MELSKVFINSIKNDFESDFWHRLTSHGDKQQARFTIKHYIKMYTFLKDKISNEEKIFIINAVNKLNNMLISENESPEMIPFNFVN